MQAVPRGAQQADDHDTVRHGVPEQQRQQPRAPGRRLGRHAQQQLDADLGWRQQWRQQQQVGQQRWQQQQQQQQQLEGGDHEPQRQRGRDSSRPGRPPAGGGRPQASSGAHTRSQLQVDPIGLTDAITAAQSVAGLQELWRQHKDHMQQIHLSAAFKAVVRVSVGLSARQQGTDGAARAAAAASASGSSTPGALQLLGHLSGRLLEDIHVARPWDLAQAAWACSKVRALCACPCRNRAVCVASVSASTSRRLPGAPHNARLGHAVTSAAACLAPHRRCVWRAHRSSTTATRSCWMPSRSRCSARRLCCCRRTLGSWPARMRGWTTDTPHCWRCCSSRQLPRLPTLRPGQRCTRRGRWTGAARTPRRCCRRPCSACSHQGPCRASGPWTCPRCCRCWQVRVVCVVGGEGQDDVWLPALFVGSQVLAARKLAPAPRACPHGTAACRRPPPA
jgi:hypothetical protein